MSSREKVEVAARKQARRQCVVSTWASVSRSNSAGTALLLSWLRTARVLGKDLAIENVPVTLRKMMLLAGLEDVLSAA
ncbi:MAG: STAS domain-containing protein [Comamonadaceae bacterium]|nr:STAS domain-containing protein [Comamonadaceae bacterium]